MDQSICGKYCEWKIIIPKWYIITVNETLQIVSYLELPGKERLSQNFSDNALLISVNPENKEEGKWNQAETMESNGQKTACCSL